MLSKSGCLGGVSGILGRRPLLIPTILITDTLPAHPVIRVQEGKQPRFPMEICERTYELATTHLKGMNYTGPVGLSCDDTKLFNTLRLYWDSEKKKHFLVGGSDGPREVSDPENVKQVIADAKIQKAAKVSITKWS